MPETINVRRRKKITFFAAKIRRTPLQQAEAEISILAQLPELMRNSMIPGPTSPEMLAENERKNVEYRKRRLAIIKKHGVIDEYLKPLRERECSLNEELKQVLASIADLEEQRG